MAKKEEISYNKALEELETILNAIETEDIDLDNLSTKIQRASYLLKMCKSKLRSTEKEVTDIINEIDKQD